ncbi:MAG: hypothetical protein FJ395_05045 [Verrucomicrobia bacterium]|nr:hypothetical protein [Verrucomicrobiota bacterium]
MKRPFAIIAVFALSVVAANARRWECYLPTGTYMVNTVQIVSISTHEYVLNAVARVTELTIATTSHVTARFYYIEPLASTGSGPAARLSDLMDRVQEKAGAVAERLGQDEVWKKVVKDYPATTHAHTVEYRVDSKEQIAQLFQSAVTAWRTGSNSVIRVTASSP